MKLFSLIISIFWFLNSFSQSSYENIFSDSLKKLSLTCYIAYLPSPQSESVILKASKTNFHVKHQRFKIRKRYKRRVTKRVKLNKDAFAKTYELYTYLNLQNVNFPIEEKDKDSLRKFINDTLYNGSQIYKLDLIQLNRYLETDSIKIDMSVFQMDSLNNFLHSTVTVIDGAPFRFQMMHIYDNNDTIVHFYKGNLFGGDRYRDFPKYLTYYTIFNETTLFDSLPFEEYFSRSNFLRVILRYIEGKEGLLEFKPFELLIEED